MGSDDRIDLYVYSMHCCCDLPGKRRLCFPDRCTALSGDRTSSYPKENKIAGFLCQRRLCHGCVKLDHYEYLWCSAFCDQPGYSKLHRCSVWNNLRLYNNRCKYIKWCGSTQPLQSVLAKFYTLDRWYGCFCLSFGNSSADRWIQYASDACRKSRTIRRKICSKSSWNS